MSKQETVARWLFDEDWDTAPQRKTDYYQLLAKSLIKECGL